MSVIILNKLDHDIELGAVAYRLNHIPLKQWIGQKLKLAWTGRLFCTLTGQQVKKLYGQGYSYEAFTTKASCDLCMVRPETCHYQQGTCREPQWGLKHCFQPHLLYLSETDQVKVGITRLTHAPGRWIDQGAHQALVIGIAPHRLQAGLIEQDLSTQISDKTNFKKMLLSSAPTQNLFHHYEQLWERWTKGRSLQAYSHPDQLYLPSQLQRKISAYEPQMAIGPGTLIQLHYPRWEGASEDQWERALQCHLNLEDGALEGRLLGIKGQYLVFDTGFFSLRKFSGYEVDVTVH